MEPIEENLIVEESHNKIINYRILKQMIDSYKNILTPTIISYLHSLIALESSALSCKEISIEDRNLLTELYLYKLICAYNIRQRTYHLVNKNINKERIKIIDENNFNRLIIYGTDQIPKHDFFIYNYALDNGRIMVEFYQLIDSPFIRKKQIIDLQAKINKAEEELKYKNSSWTSMLKKEIDNYRNTIKDLQQRKQMTEQEFLQTQIQEECIKLILGDYGIEDSEWKRDEKEDQMTNMHMTYVKSYPNITVRKRITYR